MWDHNRAKQGLVTMVTGPAVVVLLLCGDTVGMVSIRRHCLDKSAAQCADVKEAVFRAGC